MLVLAVVQHGEEHAAARVRAHVHEQQVPWPPATMQDPALVGMAPPERWGLSSESNAANVKVQDVAPAVTVSATLGADVAEVKSVSVAVQVSG